VRRCAHRSRERCAGGWGPSGAPSPPTPPALSWCGS
jgi:hypothetical protein